jgi:GNAT superfamily N-acetyltransferase
VSEQYQGQGIARALWENITTHCACRSYVVQSSLNAVPVYKRFGFIESGAVAEKDGLQFQPMELNHEVR